MHIPGEVGVDKNQGSKLGGAGSPGLLEFSYSSLKFLQGAQRCIGFCTQLLQVAFENAI